MSETGGVRRAESQAVSADAVLTGGVIRVLDARNSVAEAVAVAGGDIVAVGSAREVEAWIGPHTHVVDLAGRAVLPGINDSHLHGAWLGARWPHTFFGGEETDIDEVSGRLVAGAQDVRAAILRAGGLLAERGITSYTEPGLGPGEDDGETGCFGSDVLEVYRELAAEGKLLQRVTALALYGVLDGPSDRDTVIAGIREVARGGKPGDPRWLNLAGVKVFADMIPLTREAWTSHAYDDGSHGRLLVEGASEADQAAALGEIVRAGHLSGIQLGIHATGDRTIGAVLDAIAAAAGEPGAPSASSAGHVIIHGDLAAQSQVERMAELGVWLNTQPELPMYTHDWLASRLGAEVANQAWPLGDALRAGVLVLSSDAPVLDFDWRVALAAADRRIIAGLGPAGREDGRAGSEGEADSRLLGLLRCVTAVAAQQDGASHWKGTVAVGKAADLVVLDRDPFEVGAQGLPGLQVEATIVGGELSFARDPQAWSDLPIR